jgi:hypothetical protein
MKNKTKTRFAFLPTVMLGALTMLAGSAFAPASGLQSAPRTSGSSDVYADGLTRINFALGTTSASVTGSLAPGCVQSYILGAAFNQVMMVGVSSADSKMILQIYGYYDGTYQAVFSSALIYWQGYLPRTQDYIVEVYNSGGNTEAYTLSIEIPARIRFALGSYSGSVYGRGSAAKTISYSLWARAGQTMTATLYSSTGTVYLNIYGFSGGQSLVASSSEQTTWTAVLPQSQDYILDAVQGGTYVDFTLTVTII